MRKSYITKKNIGKIKSKTSRLIKSKKISRRRKRQNNKIQKVLKQSGSGPDLLRAASGDYGFVLEELKREIREHQAEYSLSKLRVFSSIITKLKTPDSVNAEELFQIPDNIDFNEINTNTIELILELIKEILIELEKKIEILEIGQVMPQRTSANRRTSSAEFDNFIEGIEDKSIIDDLDFSSLTFKDPTSSFTTLASLPAAIKFLKEKRSYYNKFFNQIIIEFAVKYREKMKESATTRRGPVSMGSVYDGFGDPSGESES